MTIKKIIQMITKLLFARCCLWSYENRLLWMACCQAYRSMLVARRRQSTASVGMSWALIALASRRSTRRLE